MSALNYYDNYFNEIALYAINFNFNCFFNISSVNNFKKGLKSLSSYILFTHVFTVFLSIYESF